MKNIIFLLLFLLNFICNIFGQVTTVPINKIVYPDLYSSGDSVNVDLNGDGIDDILAARWYGFDAIGYYAKTLNPSIAVASSQMYGNSYTFYHIYPYSASFISSPVGCGLSWNPNWQLRFGYYYINAPNDTTFGYITFDIGNNGMCQDTMYLVSYSYANIANTHLFSGEGYTVSIENVKDTEYNIFPNPTNGILHLQLAEALEEEADIVIYTIEGKEMYRSKLRKQSDNTRLYLYHLPQGFYNCVLQIDGNQVYSKPFLKVN